MNCEQAKSLLLDVAYGETCANTELESHELEARELESHLATCTACAAELAALREARQSLSALGLSPALPEERERPTLSAAAICAKSAQRAELARRKWRRLALTVSAVAATVLAMWFLNVRWEWRADGVSVHLGKPPAQGEVRAPSAAVAQVVDLRPELRQLAARMQRQERLWNLLAADVSAGETRQAKGLAEIDRQLRELDKDGHLDRLKLAVLRNDLDQLTSLMARYSSLRGESLSQKPSLDGD